MAHVQKQASLVKLYLDRTAIDVDKGQAGLRIQLHQAGSTFSSAREALSVHTLSEMLSGRLAAAATQLPVPPG